MIDNLTSIKITFSVTKALFVSQGIAYFTANVLLLSFLKAINEEQQVSVLS